MRTPPATRHNLTGQTFGRLTVLEEGPHRNQKRYWYCRCECGTKKLIGQDALRKGLTTSCGCFHKEIAGHNLKTHGQANTLTHRSWASMKTRCTNPNYHEYHLYGGAGITICPEWQNSFATFLRDMGPRPSAQHSIDRIDPTKGYEPGNCRWATKKVQSRNRRNVHLLTYQGETLSLSEWAERLNVPYKVLSARINRSKWPTEKAFTTPYEPSR